MYLVVSLLVYRSVPTRSFEQRIRAACDATQDKNSNTSLGRALASYSTMKDKIKR